MTLTSLVVTATASWKAVVAGLLGVVVLHRVCIIVYNLFLHPLRKFPGHKLWAISRYPSQHAVINGRIAHRINEAHQQYGPVVRIGPDELSFVQPDSWKAIYVSREFIRPPKWASQPPGVKVHNLVSAPQDDHTRLRKALGQAFSDRAVKLQEPMINRYVDLMVEKLTTQIEATGNQGYQTNIIKWLSLTTFDIINEFSYGKTDNYLIQQHIQPWKLVVRQYEARLRGVYLRYFPYLAYLGSWAMPEAAMSALWKIKGIADSNANVCINAKNEKPVSTNDNDDQKLDVLSYVFRHNVSNPSMAMTDEEILENSVILILAGGDPVNTVITSALHHLLKHPQSMQRLVEEVRNAFPDSFVQITPSSTRALPFFNAVLNEAMRLSPPTPDSIRRTIPPGGAHIAGHYVPEGSIVGVSCYAAFRYPDNFTQPDTFLPERWLKADGSLLPPRPDDGFHPFGVGAHNCLGQNLAWIELRLILARLLWSFDIELGPNAAPRTWAEQPAYWAWDKDALDVSVKLRQKQG